MIHKTAIIEMKDLEKVINIAWKALHNNNINNEWCFEERNFVETLAENFDINLD